MTRAVLLIALLGAAPAYAEERLSPWAQRQQQYFACERDAMQHKLPPEDYVPVCMKAAGWGVSALAWCQREDEPPGKLRLLNPWCYERME